MGESLLSVHGVFTHTDMKDPEVIAAWQPKSIKVVDPDPGLMDWLYRASPRSLFVLRDWAWSEQHDNMFADPEGFGVRFAEYYIGKYNQWASMIPREQVIFTHINEPHVWDVRALARGVEGETLRASGRQVIRLHGLEVARGAARGLVTEADLRGVFSEPSRGASRADAPNSAKLAALARGYTVAASSGAISAVVRSNIAFARRLERDGFGAGLLNLSVGWPANTGPDTPPDWTGYEPLIPLLGSGKHKLVDHEYWSHNGVAYMWGWWAGRIFKLPWALPDGSIVIGECGLDEGVAGPQESGHAGWRAWLDIDTYIGQCGDYDARMQTDRRIHSLEIFTYDFHHPFDAFDVRGFGAREKIVAYVQWKRAENPPTPPPPDPTPNPPPAPPPAPGGDPYYTWHPLVTVARQPAGNWFDGYAWNVARLPVDGLRVVWSVSPDGNWVTDPVTTGPHAGYQWQPGYYSHIVHVGGTIAGTWYAWLVGPDGVRISEIATWQTTGPGDGPNQATINWFETLPILPPAPEPSDVGGAMLAEAEAQQVVRLFPNAALQKAILAAGLIPTSNEYEQHIGGKTYVGQRAEDGRSGAVYAYWCEKGVYDKITRTARG